MSTLTRRDSASPRSLSQRPPFGFFREEFDNLLSRLGDWEGQWINQFASPSVDIAESTDAVDVTMDLPGMKAEDLDIRVVGNLLTISGDRKEEKGNGKSYHRVERHMGHFSRSVMLPCEVNEAKVEATYDNGVLKIQLPKTEGAKPHKIKVQEKK